MLALGTFVGAIADGSLGYQKTAAIGTVLVSASLILASFCVEIWQFYLTQGFLLGLGSALCFFPAVSIPSQWVRAHLCTNVLISKSDDMVFLIVSQQTSVSDRCRCCRVRRRRNCSHSSHKRNDQINWFSLGPESDRHS